MVAIILYLSLVKDPVPQPEILLFNGADKVAHVLMYLGATLVFILDYAKYRLPHHSRLNKELAITAGASMLGLLMEIAQLLMSNGRSYEISDWYADTAGAVAAFIIYRPWLMHKMRRYFLRMPRHHRHHSRHATDNAQIA